MRQQVVGSDEALDYFHPDGEEGKRQKKPDAIDEATGSL